MSHATLKWILFNVGVLVMLAIDLGVFHRKTHEVKVKEALAWTVVWIVLALLFNGAVYFHYGHDLAMQFLAGYLIEKSLSVDNIFIFLVLFSYFHVAAQYQHKVLFWGILGALIMRAVLITLGVTLVASFHWIIYLFGAFLIFTGVKLAFQDESSIHPEKNPVVRLCARFLPMTSDYVEGKFVVRRDGQWLFTPLFVVLLVVETTDLVFAVDSIPAVLAVSRDPFIVYTSNAFAILGLRALYFALAGMMGLFHYLKYGLSVILVFVGVKMTISDIYHIPIAAALGVIAGVLAISVIASLLLPKKTLEKP